MKLRRLEEKDATLMLEWMRDSDINYWFKFDGSKKTIDDCRLFIDNSFTSENMSYAVSDEHDTYMGTVALKNIDRDSQNAEYAIVMRKPALGKGFADFATRSILDVAFDELGLNKVYLNVLTENKRAIMFYKKFGFKHEGTFKKHLFHRSEFKDIEWYAMLKGEYEK